MKSFNKAFKVECQPGCPFTPIEDLSWRPGAGMDARLRRFQCRLGHVQFRIISEQLHHKELVGVGDGEQRKLDFNL